MRNQILHMIFSKLNVARNLILFTCLLCLSLSSNAQVSFISGELKMSINKQGSLTELTNSASGKNYLSADTLSGLITLVSKSMRFQPSSMSYDKTQKRKKTPQRRYTYQVCLLYPGKIQKIFCKILELKITHIKEF